MPSKSPAQHRLMMAVAHNPAFASKVGIPQSVGQDFANADKKLGDNFAHPAVVKRASQPKKPAKETMMMRGCSS